MEFIESPVFTRLLADYLDEERYLALQNKLASDPEAGDLMPGTGGFRKSGGLIQDAAKAVEAACGLFTTIFWQINRFG